MKAQNLVIVLTGVNLALLVLLLLVLVTQAQPVAAQSGATMLRGSGLEIVDAQGRVRASIAVMPGEGASTETVLLRLIDSNGQPSVKIGTSLTAAGISLVGGDDKSFIVLQAEGAETVLKMVEPNGREKSFAP